MLVSALLAGARASVNGAVGVSEPALGARCADTPIARLGHARYEHTVRDLLGVRARLELTFASPAAPGARDEFLLPGRVAEHS